MLQGFTMQKIDALAVLSFFTCFLLSVVSVPFEDTLYFAAAARAEWRRSNRADEAEICRQAAVVSRRERREVHLRYHRVVLRVLHRHTRGVGRGGARGGADARGAGSAVEKGADGVDAGGGAPAPAAGRRPRAPGPDGVGGGGYAGAGVGTGRHATGGASGDWRSVNCTSVADAMPFFTDDSTRHPRIRSSPRSVARQSRAPNTDVHARRIAPSTPWFSPRSRSNVRNAAVKSCRNRRNRRRLRARCPARFPNRTPRPRSPNPNPSPRPSVKSSRNSSKTCRDAAGPGIRLCSGTRRVARGGPGGSSKYHPLGVRVMDGSGRGEPIRAWRHPRARRAPDARPARRIEPVQVRHAPPPACATTTCVRTPSASRISARLKLPTRPETTHASPFGPRARYPSPESAPPSRRRHPSRHPHSSRLRGRVRPSCRGRRRRRDARAARRGVQPTTFARAAARRRRGRRSVAVAATRPSITNSSTASGHDARREGAASPETEASRPRGRFQSHPRSRPAHPRSRPHPRPRSTSPPRGRSVCVHSIASTRRSRRPRGAFDR